MPLASSVLHERWVLLGEFEESPSELFLGEWALLRLHVEPNTNVWLPRVETDFGLLYSANVCEDTLPKQDVALRLIKQRVAPR